MVKIVKGRIDEDQNREQFDFDIHNPLKAGLWTPWPV